MFNVHVWLQRVPLLNGKIIGWTITPAIGWAHTCTGAQFHNEIEYVVKVVSCRFQWENVAASKLKRKCVRVTAEMANNLIEN